MNTKRKRVLIGKIGLDGHDRGAKLVARSLCDAGVEVIYTGIRQSIDGVIATAVQEDVAVIGLSFLSGDHMALLPKVMKKLKETGLEDVKVIVGGIILPRHIDALTALGIHKIFLPGTPMEEIVDFIKTA